MKKFLRDSFFIINLRSFELYVVLKIIFYAYHLKVRDIIRMNN